MFDTRVHCCTPLLPFSTNMTWPRIAHGIDYWSYCSRHDKLTSASLFPLRVQSAPVSLEPIATRTADRRYWWNGCWSRWGGLWWMVEHNNKAFVHYKPLCCAKASVFILTCGSAGGCSRRGVSVAMDFGGATTACLKTLRSEGGMGGRIVSTGVARVPGAMGRPDNNVGG